VEEGCFIPVSPVGGQVVERVFLGQGRFLLVPPDDIEADQRELFTDGRTRAPEVSEAVFVLVSEGATLGFLQQGSSGLQHAGTDVRRGALQPHAGNDRRRRRLPGVFHRDVLEGPGADLRAGSR